MGSWGQEAIGMVELGDQRLSERLRTLIEAFSTRVGESIPDAFEGSAATNAAYRFFDNAAVEPEEIVSAMARATVRRCQGESVVLAIQDTSSFDYTDHPKTQGLGPLEDQRRQGLFVHSTLAVSVTGVPLGVISQQVWARDPEDIGKSERRKQLPVEAKESGRWLWALKQTEERLGSAGVRVVTVADREADVYELFALAHELEGEWLIRARHDRKLKDEEGKLLGAVESAPVYVCGTVEVARADDRPARQAKLEVRRARVVLVPPRRPVEVMAEWWAEHPGVERLAPAKLRPVRVGVVLVSEVDTPKGAEPLRWLLLTSLSVETTEEVLQIIAYYRLRWLVERYHFVLKSGCRVEDLQLETAQRLERALTVYGIVAWRLLWLTYEARANPQAPCTLVLDDDAWRILCALDCPTVVLPMKPPDLRTAVRRIAMLGGFLGRKGDGEPGVKTIWRGLRRLNDMVLGAHAFSKNPELLADLPRHLMYV